MAVLVAIRGNAYLKTVTKVFVWDWEAASSVTKTTIAMLNCFVNNQQCGLTRVNAKICSPIFKIAQIQTNAK